MAMQLRRDQAVETDTSRPGSQPGSTWQQWRLLLKPAEYRSGPQVQRHNLVELHDMLTCHCAARFVWSPPAGSGHVDLGQSASYN
jgi:hypothetical protein